MLRLQDDELMTAVYSKPRGHPLPALRSSGGQLQLDDVEPLGRGVQWSEVGGIPFTAVARIVRKQHRSLAA